MHSRIPSGLGLDRERVPRPPLPRPEARPDPRPERPPLGLTAAVLAVAGGWGLVELYFEQSFRLPWLPLLGLSLAVTGLTVVGGLAGSVEQLQRTPLEALRAD